MASIIVVPATFEHKTAALMLLDDFRKVCGQIIFSEPNFSSTTARERGAGLYDFVMASDQAHIFLVFDAQTPIGISTIYLIPQIRKGSVVGEIEEFFILPSHQGTEAARMLMETTCRWAKEKGASQVRLESDAHLLRAHHFYEKLGFKNYASAYILEL